MPWTVLHCGTTTQPPVGQIVHAATYGVYAHTRCSATLLQSTTGHYYITTEHYRALPPHVIITTGTTTPNTTEEVTTDF